MSRYIDVDKLYEEMLNAIAINALEVIKRQPIANVTPIIHSHWVDYEGMPVELDSNGCPKDSCWCSHCHEWLVASDEYPIISKYCPNCGAKMDEEEKFR